MYNSDFSCIFVIEIKTYNYDTSRTLLNFEHKTITTNGGFLQERVDSVTPLYKRGLYKTCFMETTLKVGAEFRGFPSSWSENKIVTILAVKHGVKVEDFIFEHGACIYKPKTQKVRKPKSVRSRSTKDFTSTEYVQIDSEVWKPLPNKSQYFKGELDPSYSVEVSNMGRVKVHGVLKPTWFSDTRNVVMVHVDSYDALGNSLKTTGNVANMVADAFIVPNGADGKTAYSIIYKYDDIKNVKLSNLIVEEK